MVALGTNEEALRLSGVSPWPIKLAVFTICGFLVGVAAVIDTSRTKCADPTSGSGIELEVIAAVVIGGTSLMGGRGSVINSLLGVLILKVVQQGLPGIGVGHAQKLLFTGIILFAAVILDYYRRRLSRRGGS
jgi:ribose transport system permease protein